MRSLLIPALAFCLVHAPSGAAEPFGQDAVSESPPPRAGRILGWFRKSGSRPGASTEVPAQPPGESPYLPYSAPPPSAASPPALRASEARPAPSRSASVDPPVRRVQAAPGEVQPTPFTPGVLQPGAGGALMSETVPSVGGQSVSLQAALYGALTSNPDLATLRLGNPTTPSAEAVEVARNFPTTLNPTLWCDLRPITLIPPDPFGGTGAEESERLLSIRPVLLLPVAPPAGRAGASDDAPVPHRQGGVRPAALDRRPGRAAGHGADLSLLRDGGLPTRAAEGRAGSSPTSTTSS